MIRQKGKIDETLTMKCWSVDRSPSGYSKSSQKCLKFEVKSLKNSTLMKRRENGEKILQWKFRFGKAEWKQQSKWGGWWLGVKGRKGIAPSVCARVRWSNIKTNIGQRRNEGCFIPDVPSPFPVPAVSQIERFSLRKMWGMNEWTLDWGSERKNLELHVDAFFWMKNFSSSPVILN